MFCRASQLQTVQWLLSGWQSPSSLVQKPLFPQEEEEAVRAVGRCLLLVMRHILPFDIY
jgi:hypothetical protein